MAPAWFIKRGEPVLHGNPFIFTYFNSLLFLVSRSSTTQFQNGRPIPDPFDMVHQPLGYTTDLWIFLALSVEIDMDQCYIHGRSVTTLVSTAVWARGYPSDRVLDVLMVNNRLESHEIP